MLDVQINMPNQPVFVTSVSEGQSKFQLKLNTDSVCKKIGVAALGWTWLLSGIGASASTAGYLYFLISDLTGKWEESPLTKNVSIVATSVSAVACAITHIGTRLIYSRLLEEANR